MTRQQLLKAIDPDFTKCTEDVLACLRPLAQQYEQYVLNDEYEQVLGLNDALNVYESFHHLTREASWGKVPLACTCEGSHAHAVREHAALFTAVFDSEVEVPKEYVAAERGLRKKCHKLKGTAGPKRMRLMEEITKGKKKSASKMGYMEMEGSGPSSAVKEHHPPSDLPTELSPAPNFPKFVLPEPSVPSFDSEFEAMCCRTLIYVF